MSESTITCSGCASGVTGSAGIGVFTDMSLPHPALTIGAPIGQATADGALCPLCAISLPTNMGECLRSHPSWKDAGPRVMKGARRWVS
jgi:hypothetical protein